MGLGLLSWATYDALAEHSTRIGVSEILIIAITAVLTYSILNYFTHNHNEDKSDVKGIAYSEFVHSLMDGAVLGIAYFINPVLGYATFLAIATHELPKIIGTVFVIRSLTVSIRDTVKYSLICQAGLPIGATFFYLLGKNIPESLANNIELSGELQWLVTPKLLKRLKGKNLDSNSVTSTLRA